MNKYIIIIIAGAVLALGYLFMFHTSALMKKIILYGGFIVFLFYLLSLGVKWVKENSERY